MKPRVHATTCIVVGCTPTQASIVEDTIVDILEHDCEIVDPNSTVTGSAPSGREQSTIAIQIEVVGPIENEPELGRVCNNIAYAVREITGKKVRISRQEAGKRIYWTHMPATGAEQA